MAATRRLAKELADLRSRNNKQVTVTHDEANILIWTATLHPDTPPYKEGAFKVEIQFPAEYPFKPPKLEFKTKIYHPNIDEKGQVCLPIVTAEHWKPATRTDQVLEALCNLLNDPEPEHPLRADLAEEYTKDRKKFMKNAMDYTRKYAEKSEKDAQKKN